MAEEIESPGNQVFVECSSLPLLLRNSLQTFLERQPEVRQVTRRLHASEPLVNPNIVGLVSLRFDLVVHLAEGSQFGAASKENTAALILKRVAEWTEAHRYR
jgi:hypothetical protein